MVAVFRKLLLGHLIPVPKPVVLDELVITGLENILLMVAFMLIGLIVLVRLSYLVKAF